MEILRNVNGSIVNTLGEQPVFANKEYRFMKYCLCLDIDDGKLIANGLTRAIIFLSNLEMEEIGDIDKYAYLYKYYFLVPEEFDETSAIDRIRKTLQIPIDDLYLNHPSSFTILTTSRCNARCFYCYENPLKRKHHMTQDTAEKIAKYILDVSLGNVTLHWFGGEPLFNYQVIDTITRILRQNKKDFVCSFTSNGYMFNKEMAEKAKNVWNTTNVQITLDGTKDVYNKTKNYIYKDDSNPYRTVLNNIARLLNLGITVTIRLNLDLYNSEDLKNLIKELYNRFRNHPKLGIYCWPIFEENGYNRTEEQREQLYKELEELENVLKTYNYFKGNMMGESVRYAQCMADNGKSVLITQDGDLGTCEHLVGSNFWGHIDNPDEKDFTELLYWRDYEPRLDICDDCPLYGECIRPTKCLEMSKCDPYIKEWNIRKFEQGLLNYYLGYREQNKNNPRFLNENVD